MTDRLLTNDALAAIAARAEAMEKLFPSTVYPHRAPDIYYSVIDAWGDTIISVTPRWLGPEDVEAARDAIYEAATDIPALLARIRAQDAELARLRDALGAVCEEATRSGDPHNLIHQCAFCGKVSQYAKDPRTIVHEPDCPIAAARALLDGGADDEGGA